MDHQDIEGLGKVNLRWQKRRRKECRNYGIVSQISIVGVIKIDRIRLASHVPRLAEHRTTKIPLKGIQGRRGRPK